MWAAGRDSTRADRIVDLDDLASYRQALDDVDVVVNAGRVENPMPAKFATDDGAAFVDITATIEYIRDLERLEPPRPVLVSVGLAPGLINLLAAEVPGAHSGPIDLVVMLGAGERHSPATTC